MTTAARARVPTEKETRAAGMLPVERPRPALIGAWAAISPPAAAVRRTATPLSTGAFPDSRDLWAGHVLRSLGGTEPSRSHISNPRGQPGRCRYTSYDAAASRAVRRPHLHGAGA